MQPEIFALMKTTWGFILKRWGFILKIYIKIDEKYYEYAIDQINKTTVNIRCVVGKTKNSPKCDSFDHLNGSERKQNLLKYLGLFSRRDSCPEEYYEDWVSETE